MQQAARTAIKATATCPVMPGLVTDSRRRGIRDCDPQLQAGAARRRCVGLAALAPPMSRQRGMRERQCRSAIVIFSGVFPARQSPLLYGDWLVYHPATHQLVFRFDSIALPSSGCLFVGCAQLVNHVTSLRTDIPQRLQVAQIQHHTVQANMAAIPATITFLTFYCVSPLLPFPYSGAT